MFRAGNICTITGLIALATLLSAASAAPDADNAGAAPRFAPDVATAWQVDHIDGDDFLPPERGPGPVRYDPVHPFIPTQPDKPIQPPQYYSSHRRCHVPEQHNRPMPAPGYR